MFLHATEMHIQLMQMLQQSSERRAFCHLGKGIDILREAFATVAELAVGSRHVGVRVVDVAREEHSRVHLAPVGTHLLAVFAAGVEVGDLIGAEHVMHVFGKLGLQRGHDGELLANKDLGEQVVCPSKHHGLLLEVLDMRALGEELGHIVHLVARLAREHLAGARQDGGTNEDRHIRQLANEFLHQTEVLGTVIFCRDVDLQESDINIAQIIIIPLGRVADEQFAFRIVVFQPIFEGSSYEATSDNSNVDHVI